MSSDPSSREIPPVDDDDSDVEMKDDLDAPDVDQAKMQFYDRSQLLSQFGDHVLPVSICLGTYSSTLCIFLFPLVREKQSHDDPETVFPVLSLRDFHSGSITQICTAGKFLFSAGFDESVHQFDMRLNRHVGMTRLFDGSLSCMKVFGPTNTIMVGSESGVVSLLKPFRGQGYVVVWKKRMHDGCVEDFAIHPSHKLALTCGGGGDNRIHLLNLLTGRTQFSLPLQHDKPCQHLAWWGNSDLLILQGSILTALRLSLDGEPGSSLYPIFRVTNDDDVSFGVVQMINEFSFITGDHQGRVRIWSFARDEETEEVEDAELTQIEIAHEICDLHMGRIKAISVTEVKVLDYLVIIASDEGGLSIWRYSPPVSFLEAAAGGKKGSLTMQYFRNWNLRFLSMGVNFSANIRRLVKEDYHHLSRRLQQPGGDSVDTEGEGEETTDF